MTIRPLDPADLPAVLDLTTATFGPFYESSYRPVVGDVVFANRHGSWREDYRNYLAGVADFGQGRYAAVAVADGMVVGYVGWVTNCEERHGSIDILAVAEAQRRHGWGHRLAEHAISAMRADGVEVVSVGTGGDRFHAPARALYESLGFTPFPNVNYTRAL